MDGDIYHMPDHETIACEKCGSSFECKVGTPDICQCQQIKLDLNELQYLAENYGGCLCFNCLSQLKAHFASA